VARNATRRRRRRPTTWPALSDDEDAAARASCYSGEIPPRDRAIPGDVRFGEISALGDGKGAGFDLANLTPDLGWS
jgi:hypothetical protein